ncbi:MAG TPA: carotenoid biosynthesis protein, partial [Micromonosporaceae bacterium]|nr:carotenoid biosynthesis protein [Micromonosporaceae bacterium]
MTAWFLLGAVVLAQIGYPLAGDEQRSGLVIVTVALGFAFALTHATTSRGLRTAGALVLATTIGGFVVEAVGVATGFPFGRYAYGTALGPTLLGVPVVIPLAWTWMAWPAWIVAGYLVPPGRRERAGRGIPSARTVARVLVAGVALAAWDLFLDPQMVADGYWSWDSSGPGLPGVPDVPVINYVAWLGVAVVMMALLAAVPSASRTDRTPTSHPETATLRTARDGPAICLYLWTYGSSVLAHAAFLGLPASAAWGGLGMGLVAVPLAVRLARQRPFTR